MWERETRLRERVGGGGGIEEYRWRGGAGEWLQGVGGGVEVVGDAVRDEVEARRRVRKRHVYWEIGGGTVAVRYWRHSRYGRGWLLNGIRKSRVTQNPQLV